MENLNQEVCHQKTTSPDLASNIIQGCVDLTSELYKKNIVTVAAAK